MAAEEAGTLSIWAISNQVACQTLKIPSCAALASLRMDERSLVVVAARNALCCLVPVAFRTHVRFIQNKTKLKAPPPLLSLGHLTQQPF